MVLLVRACTSTHAPDTSPTEAERHSRRQSSEQATHGAPTRTHSVVHAWRTTRENATVVLAVWGGLTVAGVALAAARRSCSAEAAAGQPSTLIHTAIAATPSPRSLVRPRMIRRDFAPKR